MIISVYTLTKKTSFKDHSEKYKQLKYQRKKNTQHVYFVSQNAKLGPHSNGKMQHEFN